MENKFMNFLKNNLGLIIGVIIGVLFVCFGLSYIFVNLIVIIAFGLLGAYVQKNKIKVKDSLKNLIDKM